MTDVRHEPERSLALAESVTLTFMVLLETLSPEERAVFLLREVFDYEHGEIAAMRDTTPANSRQLFHRARARIADRRPPRGDPHREESGYAAVPGAAARRRSGAVSGLHHRTTSSPGIFGKLRRSRVATR